MSRAVTQIISCKHYYRGHAQYHCSDKQCTHEKRVPFTWLWPFFELNRELLNHLPAIASRALLKLAKKKGIKPGVFTALHTFGRDLKWNVHVHISITRGGLTHDRHVLSRYKCHG